MTEKPSEIGQIIQDLREFRDERNWSQFHNPKDLAVAISVEAAELLELFLWKSPEDASMGRVKEELADIFAFAFLMADKLNLDVRQIVSEKIDQNRLKYPVEKSKGNARKYDEF